jgi:hypothetical protein
MPHIYHAFQSHFTYARFSSEAPNVPEKNKFLLYDFTREVLVNSPQKENKLRQKIVLYNPRKDSVSRIVANNLGYNAFPIIGLSLDDLAMYGSNAKVYSDFGSHPGKDRIPREMAILGCVVITGISGTASDSVDVPIDEKVQNEHQLAVLLDKTMNNYEYYYEKQKNYRDVIMNEKEEFTIQAWNVFTSIFGPDLKIG